MLSVNYGIIGILIIYFWIDICYFVICLSKLHHDTFPRYLGHGTHFLCILDHKLDTESKLDWMVYAPLLLRYVSIIIDSVVQ